MFLAFCGVTYGAYALYSLAVFGQTEREELKRKEGEVTTHISGGGLRGLAFRLGQPLFWLIALPAKSVMAALGLAIVLALPAVLIR